jgi:hypothetical protein
MAPPGGRLRTSNPGWPRGPPPTGASRRDPSAGCARRIPERSPEHAGSIPATSTRTRCHRIKADIAANTTPGLQTASRMPATTGQIKTLALWIMPVVTFAAISSSGDRATVATSAAFVGRESVTLVVTPAASP